LSKVSAIVVNYNAGSVLNETVKLLLDLKPVAQVIVVDNGSTDHSMGSIENLALSQSHLICIRNNKNLGFAKACNIGVVAAGENEYLLF